MAYNLVIRNLEDFEKAIEIALYNQIELSVNGNAQFSYIRGITKESLNAITEAGITIDCKERSDYEL